LVCFGAPVAADGQATASVGGLPSINGWVRIDTAGTVELLSNTSEIGQGTGTALAQLLAEELDVEWGSVRLGMAPVEPRYFNSMWKEYGAYGSGGIRGQFDTLRLAGAQARAMLIASAAEVWRVTPAECSTDRGYVVH